MRQPDEQPRTRLIHRLTCPLLHARHITAVDTGHHTMAWRFADGREVLTVPGRLALWYPEWKGAVRTVEVPMPDDVSPKEMVRRIDAGEV